MAVGFLEGVLPYAKNKTIFDRPLAKFEAIRFLFADMATRVKATKLLTYHVAMIHDSGQEFLKEAAMAKHSPAKRRSGSAKGRYRFTGGTGSASFSLWKGTCETRRCFIVEGTSDVPR